MLKRFGVFVMFTVSVSNIQSCKYVLRYPLIHSLLTQSKYFCSNCLREVNIASRNNPKIMQLDTPQFHSIITPELQTLFNLFEKYGYEIRIAGGAVRDLVNGSVPKDLDFATTATPSQMKEIFIKENIRMFNTNGEKHGTISVRLNDKENFEITTLRIDVKTDGRHAEVEFTTNWKLDASRRDLTINSMFMDMNGIIYDYFYGYDDLRNKRVVFVDDPDKRIKEDYLRILRYFRFYGRIADKPDNHDDEVIKAIENNKDGLNRISGERIWAELSKMLTGNFAGELMCKMIDIGLGPYIGLPNHLNRTHFEEVYNRCKDNHLKPSALLSALFKDVEDVYNCNKRLKWSSVERDLAYFITDFRDEFSVAEKPLIRCFTYMIRYKLPSIKEFVRELIKYHHGNNTNLLDEFDSTPVPIVPFNPSTLISHGVPPNKRLGLVVEFLIDRWIESDFKLTEDELVAMLPSAKEHANKYIKNKSFKKNNFPKYKFK